MPRNGKGALWKTTRRLLHRARLEQHRFNWYRSNHHNETSALNAFQPSHVEVGRYTYGPLRVIDGPGSSMLRIGSFCSIAEDVTFVLNGGHPLDRLSTFPFRAFVLGQEELPQTRGDIIVEDDVWIGHGAVILSGVKIGRGSVIAAASVVTRDVGPFVVVAGSPARHVRSRFNADVVASLSEIDLELFDESFIRENLPMLETAVRDDVASAILSALDAKGGRAS